MALRLRQAIPGQPSHSSTQNAAGVVVNDAAYIVYPSASNVVLLTPEQKLVETLQFWLALPHRASSSLTGTVEGVLGSSDDGYILAWSSIYIVLWKHEPHKAKAHTDWTVHSTVVASSPVSCMDFRDGTLALGTKKGIEYWRMNPTSEVVVWDRLWEQPLPVPASVRISPASGHLAWFSENQKSGYILTIDRKGQPVRVAQEIRHPREMQWIGWRNSAPGSDPFLFTITTNSVLRIYSPVLDDPVWFQLLYSLDHRSFNRDAHETSTKTKGKEPQSNPYGVMWVWDAKILKTVARKEPEKVKNGGEIQKVKDRAKVLEFIRAEESDVVAWISPDGSITLRSIVNMDRKPPTLLKSLPLAKSILPSISNPSYWSPEAQLLYIPSISPSLTIILPPTHAHNRISSVHVSLAELLSSRSQSISPTSSDSLSEVSHIQLENNISSFIRTPNGRGLLAMADTGEIATWYKQQLNVRPQQWHTAPKSLLGKGHWHATTPPSQAAMFSKGRGIVFYTNPPDAPATITLQHLDPGGSAPCESVILPHFSPQDNDEIEMLLAVSDIDDGFDHRGRRTQRAIIMAATRSGEAWVWRVISRMPTSETQAEQSDEVDEKPIILLVSHYRLPVKSVPRMIIPVDPMGWHQNVIDWETDTPLQDMILTVSEDGDLEFWTPKLGQHLIGKDIEKGFNGDAVRHPDRACEMNGDGHRHEKQGGGEDEPWVRTGVVRTGRKNAIMARCSSRKKTVLICELEDGRNEMTIWDSKISEFSTGLELTKVYDLGMKVQDLDWTTTSDLQSVLAVGFPHRILLICEQRMSYVERTPGWAPFLTIDMFSYTSIPINDSIWLAGGSLAVGTGNQIYLFSRFLDREDKEEDGEAEDIFQLIAQENGPLWDYHPILLGQCLLWDKANLVKSILLRLVEALKQCEEEGKKRLTFERLDPTEFYTTKTVAKRPKTGARKYEGLFASTPTLEEDTQDDFTEKVVTALEERLCGQVYIPISAADKSFLASVARVTLEVDRQGRSLDISGTRYLISIRMYVNSDRWGNTSGTVTPSSDTELRQMPKPKGASHFSFRNIVWAMHSDSQELLLEAATQCCKNGKMLWEDAKKLGVFLWLKSAETTRSQLEVIARNRFMADDDRDPTSCSLIFFALGKKKVVHGLWRQAPGHKEQKLMLKFLANDFTLDRWKTPAMKNAYALLSKQRYEYAAAFFMLAGQFQDGINVCLRQLNDWQLGLALARVVEGRTDGPIYRRIVSETVLPLAFKGGHRWLGTWAFWMLGRRDLAVRVLISPMIDVANDYSPEKPMRVGNPENDDPSLLLMFQHLKSKSLQTAKGTSEVSAKLEFDFVLHNARVFFRMGCHDLALDLLRSWSFERPFFPVRLRRISSIPPTPATATSMASVAPESKKEPFITSSHRRRPSFLLSSASGRPHGSLFMDMDVLAESGGSSRVSSPPVDDGGKVATPKILNGDIKMEEPATIIEEKKEPSLSPKAERKIGNLMKDLKQDVQQGGMEFNMDDFF
ncbi:WD-repeat protein [Cryptococcus neoformans var. grubii Br795]|nr:WD-repeat protein [Cryptococcus neoformans var. grubii Br795]